MTMKFLELKIPPVLLVVTFTVLQFIASKLFTPLGIDISLRLNLFILVSVFSGGLTLAGVWSFRKANTTVNPTKPESSSDLVQSGIYQYTRNPMYLGFSCFLFGFGIFLDNALSITLVFVFISYMSHFQIKPEEVALSKIFNEEFEGYKNKVRRWV
jgi:protein-S-isoprenylcysteine O-methyltransferase Ste14